jgi:predicted AlkP superfamily pyrophosphatase or phosphodiesterase
MLIFRIHTIGLKYRADTLHGHPDSRAQMFESHKYNRRKIKDLLIMLDGLGYNNIINVKE